ncbi:guanine-1-methyltransferase-domain-containing protein [Chaetomium strumarium]|uniref:tRNA (guanine(9)-N1)-methyltransferase n=1 Tax=Chaetomium strumarium TaxID=1170767 RepID=A0AAJ0M1T0_9PEZI|nr:guanine-1-methyltransferase-domain-containing protein [Chaetomium strumarium]
MEEPLQSTETVASSAANGKRKAETELEREAKKSPLASNDQSPTTDEAESLQTPGSADTTDKPLSKNQLKRLRRQQQWEEYKQDRRAKRKDKRHERQARKRAEKEAKIAEAEAAGIDPAAVLKPQKEPWKYRPVPISFIIDCDFEQYMREQEIVSLSSQIVRSYAMNRKSKYQASLHLSSWKGKLKERFETVLKNAHMNWKNVSIHEGDFREAAKQAREQMMGLQGGEMIDLIKPSEDGQKQATNAGSEGACRTVEAEPEGEDVDRTIVYLTSESPYTLERLEANTCYIIGGLVDRNREKGLCYNRAREHKVRTAKLPIGEYMAMQSRYVLTTNQVVEIMARWLECGDWGKAFLDVIPKRKGGTLKSGDVESRGSKEENGVSDEGEDESAEEDAPGAEMPSADKTTPQAQTHQQDVAQ